jgi:phosphonate transport system ATP-binding protein
MTAIVEIIDLSKHYPNTPAPALNQVSFTVEHGQFTAILGRSGSGKSTLFRCLNLLVRRDAGQVRVLGKDWQSLSTHDLCLARRQMATIFQQYNLMSRLTVIENVLAGQLAYVPFWRAALRRFPARYEAWALHCLERVGLSEYADRRASQLSGGQQQRVAIARALAQRPKIILADEPVASLDPESALVVLDELRSIAKVDGITILCSLHQENYAMQYADHIIGLRDGRVVADVRREDFTPEHRQQIYYSQPAAD